MKASTKPQLGLLILNRDNFYIYTPGITGFLTLTFPERTVKNLEILNQQELESQINQLVETSKIAPAELTIILSSDILFEKEIAGGPEENASRQKFLDSLPFDSVYKVVIPKDQKPYIITVNRDFLDGIIRGFSNLGFIVARAVPYEFLRKNAIQTVDVNNAMDIIKKAESMKFYNMIDFQQKKQNETTSVIQNNGKNGNKTRLFVLLGMLGISVLILIYFFTKK